MATNRSDEAFAFVVCAASLVELGTDTPWRRDHWIGPFFQLTPATQATSATCAACLVFLALFLLVGRFGDAPDRTGLRARLLGLLPAVSMIYALYWAHVFVGHGAALPWNVMAVTAPVFVGVAVLQRWPAIRVAGVALFVGIILRLVLFARFSIDEGADMLPLTRAALDNLVHGASPYAYYDLPDPLPLTYLPLTWLAYLPPYLARIDLRWTNLIAEVAIVAALVWATRDRPDGDGDKGLLAWSFVFLLPSSVYFDRITTAPVAWALITWCLALLARRSRHDWVLLGAAAAATPLAAVIVPFAGVLWWRQHSFRGALRRAVQAGLLTALVLAPFVLWSPRGFLEGTVLWFNDLSRYPGVAWKAYQPWARYIGFGGLFWRRGLERALAPIQWLLVSAIAFLFARKKAQRIAAHVAAAFVAFMAFNSVHWPYFYQPALFLGLVAIVTADSGLATEAGPAA